jgi:chromosome segregation ATPase
MPVDPEELFRQIQNDLDSIRRRLPELRLRIMELKSESQAKEERIWELEQVADPDHDGYPLCDR